MNITRLSLILSLVLITTHNSDAMLRQSAKRIALHTRTALKHSKLKADALKSRAQYKALQAKDWVCAHSNGIATTGIIVAATASPIAYYAASEPEHQEEIKQHAQDVLESGKQSYLALWETTKERVPLAFKSLQGHAEPIQVQTVEIIKPVQAPIDEYVQDRYQAARRDGYKGKRFETQVLKDCGLPKSAPSELRKHCAQLHRDFCDAFEARLEEINEQQIEMLQEETKKREKYQDEISDSRNEGFVNTLISVFMYFVPKALISDTDKEPPTLFKPHGQEGNADFAQKYQQFDSTKPALQLRREYHNIAAKSLGEQK